MVSVSELLAGRAEATVLGPRAERRVALCPKCGVNVIPRGFLVTEIWKRTWQQMECGAFGKKSEDKAECYASCIECGTRLEDRPSQLFGGWIGPDGE